MEEIKITLVSYVKEYKTEHYHVSIDVNEIRKIFREHIVEGKYVRTIELVDVFLEMVRPNMYHKDPICASITDSEILEDDFEDSTLEQIEQIASEEIEKHFAEKRMSEGESATKLLKDVQP